MAFVTDTSRPFRLYVTHVDGEGHFLKISGQLDQHASLMVETLFEKARDILEKGRGVHATAIQEGTICAAKYKDGTYYRAKIINTTNLATGLVGVHFIDFGNKDTISLSTIRLLDQHDPMFLQLPGQATDYYLSRVIHPSGRWEEQLLLKLQSLLCYSDYPATIEAQTRTLPFIAIQFKGNDLSTHLVANRFGVALPLAKQEILLLQMTGEGHQLPNWQPSYVNESPSFPEHVPFFINQNFPANPASAMRLQQNMTLPFNSSVPSPSLVSQRLVNKVSRNQVHLRAPVRQPQHAVSNSPQSPSAMTPPLPSSTSKTLSPKKSTTYKSRLLEIGSQHKVCVSFAEEGPELFAVQLVADANKLQDMMDEINKRPHSSLAEPPMIGTVCLGRMPGDRIICRAIVMNLSGSQCKLFFVDFGDTEMISYYDIFDIPEEFVKPNVFALRFCLSGVKNLEKGPQLNEAFKQLVNGKVLTLKVVIPEGPPLIQYGELYLDNKNVMELLMTNMKDKPQFKWIDRLALGSRCSVLVSYVDSCIKFYAQLSDQITDLNAVMDAVKVHCECTSSPGELAVGTACCAKFPDDDNWYRAIVRGQKGNKVVVSYVDYGNEQEINVEDLRTVIPDLIKLPAQAMRCALKGFENRQVETKTSNQLEMLALEKTLMAHVVGMLSSDTMLVTLVDDTVSPPLDIAKKMIQLSQPRSNTETKPTTPVRKDALEEFSSPESNVQEEIKKKSFRKEKSFKDDRRPPRENNHDFGQRGGSFRSRDNKDTFERSGPGRHSEKYAPRPDKGDRRGGSKPWENKSPPTATTGDDEWEETPSQPTYQPPPNRQNRDRDNRDSRDHRENRDSDNKYNNNKDDEWEENGSRDTASRPNNFRSERREPRGERRDNWGDKKENWNQKRDFKDRANDRPRSNFTPRDRADRSFNSDSDKKSDKSFRTHDNRGDRAGRAPPYKPRGHFTQVQYKELISPVSLETKFKEPSVEPGAQHEVSVTWIISPESFYTQIMSLQPGFLEMMHKIPELYKGVKSYTGNVPEGGSVLARYPVDGVLYRATIISVQPFSKFIVQYVDFGNKQLVDAKDIWQLSEALMELPKMAVYCSLIGVSPKDGEWKADPEIDLCFNAPRYQCIFQDCVDGKYRASLWNHSVSVADTLVEKGLGVASEQQSSVTLKDEAIDLTIIIGQQILCKVTHVESFEKFYVQLDLEKATLVETAINNFDTSLLTPLAADSLADGIHCTVKHEGKIYRSILNDVSDPSDIKVVLPDYGTVLSTTLENLMILPTELTVYYYQSLECCLNNYTSESNKLMTLEELTKKLTGNKYIVYVNSVEGISLVTTLYDPMTGKKIEIFEPDEGAYEEVIPLCMRAVFNYNFGMACILHAENLNEMYLQKSSDSDLIAHLLDDLFKFYEEGTPKPLDIFEVDGLCAAKSSDSNWYRATIVSVEEAEVKVQFCDYGNMETIPKDSVMELNPKFYEPCALALVVSLGLVALQDDAITKLTEWTTDKDVQVTLSFGNDGWLANLHLDGVDLSMKLVNEKLATPQLSASEEQKVEEVTEEPVSLPSGCVQVYISHIDSPGHFWLQVLNKIDKIEEIQAELQANAANYPDVENCEIGTFCIAKYSADDQWYRAEILDSDSDIITVRFIDYGNTDVLDNKPGMLKAIPESLKEVEPYAIKSSVNAVPSGTGQWSEPASNYFTELVGDLANPVDVLIVLKDVTTYVDIFVNGQNLTDKLVSEGHATKSEETECGDLPSCFASHVNSPSEFWIQLETATPELQAVENAMVDAENFPGLNEKEEGVICAAKYPEDGAWYRAQVIVDGSEGTEVLFMDYGNASIATELRSLPDELKSKPALSRKCALQKPRDIKSWSRKSEIKFNELAAEGATIFNVQFIASGDISIVELYLDGKSVTEELVGLCDEQPVTERPSPVGQDLQTSGKISYVNSVDEFYVQLDNSIPEQDKILERLQSSNDFESASELKVGSTCVGFWDEDEQWYRCKILEFCDVGYHVQFIDYGNKAKCQDFRQIPEDLLVIEPLAKCCCLVGYSDDNALKESAKTKLNELAAEESSTFLIEFLDSTKEPSLVRLMLNGVDVNSLIRTDTTTDKIVNDSVPDPVPKDNKSSDVMAMEEDISEINKSNQDLEESFESCHTVIEKSFEEHIEVTDSNQKTDVLSTTSSITKSSTEDLEVTNTSQESEIPATVENNVSSETLSDSITETVKTHESDNSKDSITTDTGYASGDLEKSPTNPDTQTKLKASDDLSVVNNVPKQCEVPDSKDSVECNDHNNKESPVSLETLPVKESEHVI